MTLIRIEKYTRKKDTAEYRFIRKIKRGEAMTLKVICGRFKSTGLVPEKIISSLSADEKDDIIRNLPQIIERVSSKGAF